MDEYKKRAGERQNRSTCTSLCRRLLHVEEQVVIRREGPVLLADQRFQLIRLFADSRHRRNDDVVFVLGALQCVAVAGRLDCAAQPFQRLVQLGIALGVGLAQLGEPRSISENSPPNVL